MVILDVETTGFNPRKDKIIEVAVLKVNKGRILDSFSTLINPHKAIPRHITKLTGLTQADINPAPTFQEIELQLFEFMKGHRIYGYNISFDKRFLVKTSRRFSCFTYRDYLKWLKERRPDYKDYKMKSVAKRHGIKVMTAHRAADDVLTLWEIMRRLGWA